MADHPLLTINKNQKGISISAEIYSADGRIVAELRNNEFNINPNNYFRRGEPNNKHSLVVYDQRNIKVLDVYFINKNAIKVKGIFRVPGSFPVIITDDKIIRSGSEGISSSDDCHIDVGGILNFDF